MSKLDDVDADSRNFGQLLAEAREAQDYTVEEINIHLKIPVAMINALESSDLDVLPAPTYTQGYIKNYAKFLEISEDAVLRLYNEAAPHDQIDKLKARSNLSDTANRQTPFTKVGTAILAVMGLTAVLVGIFQYYQEKSDDIETEFDAKEPGFTGNSLDSPGMLDIKQNARMSSDGELIVEKTAASESLAASIGEVEPEVVAAEVEVVEEEPVEPKPVLDKLELNAENGAWIEVLDANQERLFYNMIPKGGSKQLTGLAPFSIFLGNARTTKIEINDLEIDMTKHIRSNNTVKIKVSSEEDKVVFY